MKDYKRIVCCLETWIKEIEADPNMRDTPEASWLTGTYYNELVNGEYVDNIEYEKWLKKEGTNES